MKSIIDFLVAIKFYHQPLMLQCHHNYSLTPLLHVQTDLNFPDTPRAFAWVGDSLIACIKKDLYHVQVISAWHF